MVTQPGIETSAREALHRGTGVNIKVTIPSGEELVPNDSYWVPISHDTLQSAENLDDHELEIFMANTIHNHLLSVEGLVAYRGFIPTVCVFE